MTTPFKLVLGLAGALALAGCATPADSSTYTGSAKAAVLKKTQAANAYIRSAFSTPMPAWEVSTSNEGAAARQPAVDTSTPQSALAPAASAVVAYPVSAPDSATPAGPNVSRGASQR